MNPGINYESRDLGAKSIVVFLIVLAISGILIAFLARNHPFVALIVAVLIADLFVMGRSLQIFYQMPFSMVQLIEAIIVICVAASEFVIRNRVHWVR